MKPTSIRVLALLALPLLANSTSGCGGSKSTGASDNTATPGNGSSSSALELIL